MTAAERVTARLIAGGFSAAEAAAAVGSVAEAGYTMAPRASTSPAGLSTARGTFVRALSGRAGASVHAVSAGADGLIVWVEIAGKRPVRISPVFVPGDGESDPFVVV